jgi:hypothetical protein
MNRVTPIRLKRTILLGLVVASAIGTTSAVAASQGQLSPPPGATAEPVAASQGQFSPPPGATAEPVAPSPGQFSPPPGAAGELVVPTGGQPALSAEATVEPAAAAAQVPSSPVVEVPGGLDWADAGIGAGIAFGSILLLGGALLMRRAGLRHRLATR